MVTLPDGGQATASVELKFLGGRRVYAYLRHTEGGRTVSRYVGEVPGKDREERRRGAWRQAREKRLLAD
jgi:DNA mismatch endonuclease (patch repair protein)